MNNYGIRAPHHTKRIYLKKLLIPLTITICIGINYSCSPDRSYDKATYIKQYAKRFLKTYTTSEFELSIMYYAPQRYLVANLDTSNTDIDPVMKQDIEQFKKSIFFQMQVKPKGEALVKRMMDRKKAAIAMEPDIEMSMVGPDTTSIEPVQILWNKFTHDDNTEEYLISFPLEGKNNNNQLKLRIERVFGHLVDTRFTWKLSKDKVERLPQAYREWERYL